MAQWLIFKAGVAQAVSGKNQVYDDANAAKPGEDGFSRSAVDSYCASLGAGYGANYMGQSISETLPPIAGVPQEVTKRQAAQALILAGLDDNVDAMLEAMSGQAGKLARAEWHESNTVLRTRPLVVQMGAALGLTDAQLDQLFVTAAGL